MSAVHRTILVVDVAGFGDPRRTNQHQLTVRQGLYRLLVQAFERADISWRDCDHEDRGDGVLVLISATVAKDDVIEKLPTELVSALRAHNAEHAVAEQIRLRMALHAGEIHYDEHGVVGRAVNLAFRLLEAPALKTAQAESSGLLALIVSSWFFDEVVWHSAAAARDEYYRVEVAVKETNTVAWIRLPDSLIRPPSAARPTASSPFGAPHQLPTDIRQFVGRQRELDQLMALLDDTARTGTVVITAIDGSAGIGKTTLALHWAHRVKDRFPDGQLHVNLRGFDPGEPMDAEKALSGFLRSLGLSANAIPVDLDAKAALYRSLLADRRMLIVLDNARSADQVRPLLPASPTCTAVITSRRRLDGLVVREGALQVTLDVLSPSDALALLAKRITDARISAERAAAAEVVERCSRLPLALSIVAAHAAAHPGLPLSKLTAELRDERGRLDFLDLGDTDLNVRTVFSWSTNILSAPAAQLFRFLGLHPGPDIDLYGCGTLAGTLADARKLIKELTGAHLITEYTPGRFRFHDLLRAYATEQAEQPLYSAECGEVAERILDYYVRLGLIANQAIQPSRAHAIRLPEPGTKFDFPDIDGYRDGIAWFTVEAPVLLALITFAENRGLGTPAWQLAWISDTYLRRSGRRQDRAAAHRTAVAGARRAGDRFGEATALRHLGSATFRVGRPAEALDCLRQAMRMYETLRDRTGRIATHLAYTRVFDALQDHQQALAHAQQAWGLVRGNDNRLRQGDALTAMGRQLAVQGRQVEALPLCEQALAHYSAVGHTEGEADVLINIGEIEQQLGRHEQAAQRYQRSLELDRWLGDRYWEAHALEHLGDAHLACDDRTLARQSWDQSAAILTELRHPDAERVRGKVSGLTG